MTDRARCYGGNRLAAIVGIGIAVMLLTGCDMPLARPPFTITVDNRLGVPVTLVVTEFGPPIAGGGHPPLLAEPIVVQPGEHEVQLPDPGDQWSLWQQGQNTSFDGSELREWAAQRERGELGLVRLVIDPDGMVLETAHLPPD